MADLGNDPKTNETQDRPKIQATRRSHSADRNLGSSGHDGHDGKTQSGTTSQQTQQQSVGKRDDGSVTQNPQQNMEIPMRGHTNMEPTGHDGKTQSGTTSQQTQQQSVGKPDDSSVNQNPQQNIKIPMRAHTNMEPTDLGDSIIQGKNGKTRSETSQRKLKQQSAGKHDAGSVRQKTQHNSETNVEKNTNIAPTDLGDVIIQGKSGKTGSETSQQKPEQQSAGKHDADTVSQKTQQNSETHVGKNTNIAPTGKDGKTGSETSQREPEQPSAGKHDADSVSQKTQQNSDTNVGKNTNIAPARVDGKTGSETSQQKPQQQSAGKHDTGSVSQKTQHNSETHVVKNTNIAPTDLGDVSIQGKDGKTGSDTSQQKPEQPSAGKHDADSVSQKTQQNSETHVGKNTNIAPTVAVDIHTSEHTDGTDTGSTKTCHLLTEENTVEGIHEQVSESQSPIAIGDIKGILDEIRRQIAQLQEQHSRDKDAQENNFKIIQHQAEEVKKEKDKLRQEIAQLQGQHSRDMHAQEDKFKIIQHEAEELKREKDELRQGFDQQLKQIKEDMEKHIGDGISKLTFYVQQLKKQLADIETRTQKQSSDVQEQLQTQSADIDTRINQQSNEIRELLKSQLAEMMKRGDDMRDQGPTAQQNSQFDEQSNEVKQLQEQYVDMAKEIKKLFNYVLQQQQLIDQSAEREERSKQQSSDFQEQLQKQPGKIEMTIRQQSHEIQELKNQLAEMMKRGNDMGDQGPAAHNNTQIGDAIMTKLLETESTLNNLTKYGEYLIKTECEKISDTIEKMESKHKQQLGRHSKRITKCEEEYININDEVKLLVHEIVHVKEKHDTQMTDIDGRMEEMRNEMVDGDQLRETIMNQFDGKLGQYEVNQNYKLESSMQQLQTYFCGYVDQKNKGIEAQMMKLDSDTDYELGNLKTSIEEELHKIRENYKYLSSKVKDVQKSCTESHEVHINTIQQQFTDTEKVIVDLEERMLDNVKGKLKELQGAIVNGNLMDNSKLNQTYTTYFSTMDGRLKIMESKQRSVDTQLRDTHTLHREQLEQGLKQLEQKLCQRDADVSNEANIKREELRTEINGQLTIAKSHLEALNTSLHLTGAKIQIIETIQNRAPIGFTARATGYQLSTRYPIMKGFNEVTCNDGGYYNTLNGIFTAPIAGVYVVNLTHTQSDDGEIYLNVVQGHRFSDLKTLVAYTWTYGKHSTSSDSAVVKMQEGDSLYVKLQHYSGNGQIWSPSSFSCFLLR